ncbi:MAG: hypothetical protein R3E01_09280 [Pirellulaceae bacterium]|nr:hypothetical protein [Planctomycetales bacterium]
MARKVVNRKELRAQAEAAEAAEKAGGTKKKAAATKKKAETGEKKVAKPRKSRAKTVAETRKKLFWGVFNQSMKRVALYEFTQRKQAEKKAADLSKAGKSEHFVQRVKEDIEQ